MDFDLFFSISRTPVDGVLPDERAMWQRFFAEVEAGDALGYGCVWFAEAHFSTEVQKRHAHPVVPHWQGEIGLNDDSFQLASAVLARTRNVDVGSAVLGLFAQGGPLAHAERAAAFASLHGLDPDERRRFRLGFAAGRFDFVNRAYGVFPRDAAEEAAWPALRGQVFREACEVFLRLVRGDELASADVAPPRLARGHFRSDEDWQRACSAWSAVHGEPAGDELRYARRWEFDVLKVVPEDFRREVLDLHVGSHDPALQEFVNTILPVKVFNLSITRPEVVEATHERMRRAFHPDGGPWRRSYMPRTVMVFLDPDATKSPEARSRAAHEQAEAALSAYWTALEGTLDPAKVQDAADNALVGSPEEVAAQVRERFHPDDRLMLWFDFFDHDAERVIGKMESFRHEVVPLLDCG